MQPLTCISDLVDAQGPPLPVGQLVGLVQGSTQVPLHQQAQSREGFPPLLRGQSAQVAVDVGASVQQTRVKGGIHLCHTVAIGRQKGVGWKGTSRGHGGGGAVERVHW